MKETPTTQEKDKQEKHDEKSPSHEIPEADLDKVSGGTRPAVRDSNDRYANM